MRGAHADAELFWRYVSARDRSGRRLVGSRQRLCGIYWRGWHRAGRRRRRVDEPPVRVRGTAGEGAVLRSEVFDFEWLVVRTAVHADDPIAHHHQPPVGATGDRIAVDLAQVALHHRKTLVLQQFFQLAGELLRSRRGLEVAADGLSKLPAHEQQFALALTLGGGAPDLPAQGEADADQDYRDQQTDVCEPRAPSTLHLGPR